MACFNPLRAVQFEDGGPLLFLQKGQLVPPGSRLIRPNCRRCLGCRTAHSAHMGARLLHESVFHDHSFFLTLTYRDEDKPLDGGLSWRDVQLFMKKLRKAISPVQVKFSGCGEYGPDTLRPHYHLIIFGWWPEDAQPVERIADGWQYDSELIREVWAKGNIQFRPMDFASACYLARHNFNKVTGGFQEKIDPVTGLRPYDRIHEHTGEIVEVSPEMFHQSRGIGLEWLKKYYKDCFPEGETPIPHELRCFPGVPEYYVRKLEEIDPVLHLAYQDRMKEQAIRLEDSGYYSRYHIEARRKIYEARKTLFKLYAKVEI